MPYIFRGIIWSILYFLENYRKNIYKGIVKNDNSNLIIVSNFAHLKNNNSDMNFFLSMGELKSNLKKEKYKEFVDP